jgi:hypothetical protein
MHRPGAIVDLPHMFGADKGVINAQGIDTAKRELWHGSCLY